MHGEIGPALGHRGLELLDEQALAADVGQRLVEDVVALRGQPQQRDLAVRIQRREAIADVPRLPQRQRGFARRDDQPPRREGRNHEGRPGEVRRARGSASRISPRGHRADGAGNSSMGVAGRRRRERPRSAPIGSRYHGALIRNHGSRHAHRHHRRRRFSGPAPGAGNPRPRPTNRCPRCGARGARTRPARRRARRRQCGSALAHTGRRPRRPDGRGRRDHARHRFGVPSRRRRQRAGGSRLRSGHAGQSRRDTPVARPLPGAARAAEIRVREFARGVRGHAPRPGARRRAAAAAVVLRHAEGDRRVAGQRPLAPRRDRRSQPAAAHGDGPPRASRTRRRPRSPAASSASRWPASRRPARWRRRRGCGCSRRGR